MKTNKLCFAKKIKYFSLIILLIPAICLAGNVPGKFSWSSVTDMQGAFFMCASLGFPNSDCRKVLRKCYTDPRLIDKKKSFDN